MIFVDEIKHAFAGFVGGATFVVQSGLEDMISRVVIGIAVGVGTWIITKTISYLIKRLK